MGEMEIYRSDVNYDVTTRDFKFYIFDWDDNILHMPTKIHLEKKDDDGVWRPVEVSRRAIILPVSGMLRPPSTGQTRSGCVQIHLVPSMIRSCAIRSFS